MGLGFNDGFVPKATTMYDFAECKSTPDADIVGTHKVSSITATRDQLTEVFGKPTLDICDKVTTQWVLTFHMPDGEELLATIYDYKEPAMPTANQAITWSIGGHISEVEYIVKEFFEGAYQA